MDWSLVELQSYVVELLFEHFFTVLQPIKLILNISKIIRSYSRYEILNDVFSSLRLISDDFQLKSISNIYIYLYVSYQSMYIGSEIWSNKVT